MNALTRSSKNHVGLLTSPCGFKISNLVFTDECWLFPKATSKAARNILGVLNSFARASGEKNRGYCRNDGGSESGLPFNIEE